MIFQHCGKHKRNFEKHFEAKKLHLPLFPSFYFLKMCNFLLQSTKKYKNAQNERKKKLEKKNKNGLEYLRKLFQVLNYLDGGTLLGKWTLEECIDEIH